MRLALMYEARMERDREAYRIAQAARLAGEGAQLAPHAPPPPMLPDLGQVAGWGREDAGKAPADPKRALFGGWRLREMRGKLGGRI